MPELADGGGRSSFAFVLPADPGWANQLASITLIGPEGSATLDRRTDLPMAIFFDPGSGQVQGFVQDPPLPEAAAAPGPPARRGVDMLFSRGIPDAAAWTP